MNRTTWMTLGRILYYLLYPALQMYMRGSTRTRVALRYKNKVLLVRPWLGSGAWDFPGGGVHQGEDIRRGALRELYEEVGITLSPKDLSKRDRFVTGYKFFLFEVVCFIAHVEAKPVLRRQALEIAEVGWFTRRATKQMKLEQGVNEAIARCFKV